MNGFGLWVKKIDRFEAHEEELISLLEGSDGLYLLRDEEGDANPYKSEELIDEIFDMDVHKRPVWELELREPRFTGGTRLKASSDAYRRPVEDYTAEISGVLSTSYEEAVEFFL